MSKTGFVAWTVSVAAGSPVGAAAARRSTSAKTLWTRGASVAVSRSAGAKTRPPGRRSWKTGAASRERDRKSTRLNSSHLGISYAVFCLKKKKTKRKNTQTQQEKGNALSQQ